ncbi:MAG: hypothetical protein KQH63_08440 [Desulfobulbaceae bacterium]|nr:hypothetical protein [Desulfobulbaceae bacterium]
MKFDYKRVTGFLSAIAFTGVLLGFAGNAVSEEYDEDTYGPEAPIVFTSPVKAVIFTHKLHTMDVGLECDSCHDEIFEMEIGSAEANGDYTMQSLYDGKYCGACHDGDTAFASDTRCTVCHIGVKGFDRMFGSPKTDSHSGGNH